ncbi:30S ribosomal protein S21 [Mesorhizobium captivum]|uniref:30S ribosomal protein S21 n=1 Tax=Mesorhizobium captivum TaxID=3072319 RepID=UPI003D315E2A
MCGTGSERFARSHLLNNDGARVGQSRTTAVALGASGSSGDELRVDVRNNDVDQALRALKRKLQREGLLRELKRRRAYEKPSERRVRERGDAIRRARKLARKQAQREGLLPAPKKKPSPVARRGRNGPAGSSG